MGDHCGFMKLHIRFLDINCLMLLCTKTKSMSTLWLYEINNASCYQRGLLYQFYFGPWQLGRGNGCLFPSDWCLLRKETEKRGHKLRNAITEVSSREDILCWCISTNNPSNWIWKYLRGFIAIGHAVNIGSGGESARVPPVVWRGDALVCSWTLVLCAAEKADGQKTTYIIQHQVIVC